MDNLKLRSIITNKEYQKICTTSNGTASRDLADLVSSGLFEQVGITGKGTVYIIRYRKDAKDATKAP
jgi:predicted HTH transcriptional regulator